jgi:hypothetical protein
VLTRTDLRDADLRGVDFRGVNPVFAEPELESDFGTADLPTDSGGSVTAAVCGAGS